MAQITSSLINLWRKSLSSGYHIGSTTGEEAQLLDAWEELQRLQVALDPRRWTTDHHEAWSKNLLDVHAAFAALKEVRNTD